MPSTPNALDAILAETPRHVDVYVSSVFDLAEQVSAVLKSRNMSRRALAQELGKSESEISKWLSGLHNLTLQSVAKLSDALQTDLLVTPLKPQGYFGLQSQLRAQLVAEIHPFEKLKPSVAETVRFTVTVNEPTGERMMEHSFAA